MRHGFPCEQTSSQQRSDWLTGIRFDTRSTHTHTRTALASGGVQIAAPFVNPKTYPPPISTFPLLHYSLSDVNSLRTKLKTTGQPLIPRMKLFFSTGTRGAPTRSSSRPVIRLRGTNSLPRSTPNVMVSTGLGSDTLVRTSRWSYDIRKAVLSPNARIPRG